MPEFDLSILVPSRGRPARMIQLAEACSALCTARTRLVIGLDDDDPTVPGYVAAMVPQRGRPPIYRQSIVTVDERRTFTQWTNDLWRATADSSSYFASLGDDHVPETTGWDSLLIGAIERMGGTGIAYGNDLAQGESLPTAPVLSADIPAALGWVCLPRCRHYYVDNAWLDLGQGAGCLAYLDEVTIRHDHPAATGQRDKWDATYTESLTPDNTALDHASYQAWRDEERYADVLTVIRLTEARQKSPLGRRARRTSA